MRPGRVAEGCSCAFGIFGRHTWDCAAYADDPPPEPSGWGRVHWGRYGDPTQRHDTPPGKAAWTPDTAADTRPATADQEPKTA